MLELCTGCRLHFGLMELAAGQPHRFAGLGLMVQAPRVRVRIGPRSALDADCSTNEEIATRVRATVAHAEQTLEHRLRADWTVAAIEHPRLHSGLGLGTQLAAAVATAMQLANLASLSHDNHEIDVSPWRSCAASMQLASPSPEEASVDTVSVDNAAKSVDDAADGKARRQAEQVRRLARLSGRGKRSAVGLHGFLFGGLVQDLGQSASGAEHPQTYSPPLTSERNFGTRSRAFPSAWPIVLILSTEDGGMCGAAEEQLINRAGAVPNCERATMLELSHACMAAASLAHFQRFAESLERYMDIAATLFASVQAGRYRNERIATRVELARRAGLRGVGQSSWGPTVFAFSETAASAEQAAAELRAQLKHESVEVIVTRAANQGASWRPLATGVQHAG